MKDKLVSLYVRVAAMLNMLRSPLLLAVRLYFGWQFAANGWGKLHTLPKITEFFASLHIPFPGPNAVFVSLVEFVGGILLMLGLATRPVAVLILGDMLVAYWTADHEAFLSFFKDPDKFTGAAPFDFLAVALLVLVFGAGKLSLDALIAKKLGALTEPA